MIARVGKNPIRALEPVGKPVGSGGMNDDENDPGTEMKRKDER